MYGQIAENVKRINQRIAEAAIRSGRQANDVALVAVTKYVDSQTIRALVRAGCTQLGESRPQQFWGKAAALDDLPIRWHMIGHLQRNKVKRTLPLVHLLHAGDSLRLLKAVHEWSLENQTRTDVLIEVNISGDQTKHGFPPEGLESLLPELASLTGVRIRGLMGMAAWGTDAREARRDFAALRTLRDRLSANCPPEISLRELSMGMSGDFETAIEEGATMVRIGSALFEGV